MHENQGAGNLPLSAQGPTSVVVVCLWAWPPRCSVPPQETPRSPGGAFSHWPGAGAAVMRLVVNPSEPVGWALVGQNLATLAHGPCGLAAVTTVHSGQAELSGSRLQGRRPPPSAPAALGKGIQKRSATLHFIPVTFDNGLLLKG